MNERIRELALQAKLGPALLLHHYGTVDALTDTEQDELEQMEKFAQLIVSECVGKIELEAAQYAEPVWAFEIVNDIKEHFGVKS